VDRTFPWRTLVIGVGAIVLVVAGFVIHGIIVLLRDPSGYSLAYANRIRVTGYTDISTDHSGGGSCGCIQRWYIGSVVADPTPDFSGPGLVWTKSGPQNAAAGNPVGWTVVGSADVTTDRSGPCTVDIVAETPQYLRLDEGIVEMSSTQISQWQQAQLQVVELDVRRDRDVSG
jgi:hypothetical protein